MSNLQEYIINITIFLNTTLVPFLFILAFVFFTVNVARYFIIGGSNQTEQEKAKKYAIWSISAFVLMISIWGIVNLLTTSFGLCYSGTLEPDYFGNQYDTGLPCNKVPTPTNRPYTSESYPF